MRPRNRAFTLIELILAIAITAILAATVYASLMIATTTRDKASSTVGKDRALRLALELVRRDLQSVPPPTGELAGGFLGEDDSRQDVIGFTTANSFLPPDGKLSDLISVSLELAEDTDDSDSFMLVRYLTTNLLAPATTDPETQVLARGLSGWDVQYSDGSDWLDDWDSTQQDNTLPLAVRVTLYHPDEDARYASSDDLSFTQIIALPAGTRSDSILSGGG